MHIVLGLLGAVITILILLNRLAEAGIDLGGLNPFLWHRRRQWRKKLEGNPVYSVDSPMDATALLIAATAKIDGDMSAEEKQTILSLFESEFHLSKREASGLLISSTHLLGKGDEVYENPERVLKPSLEVFTREQADSAMDLLDKASRVDSPDNELKRKFVERVNAVFKERFASKGKWQ